MRGEGYSLADIAAATGNNGNNGGNNGFDNGEGAWWIIIFLIFAFLGWGRGGFGNNGSGTDGSGAAMNYVLSSDFATLQRLLSDGFNTVNNGINQVNQGICNLGYSTLENFNTTNMNLATGFANLNNAFCNQSFQIERGIAGLGTQLQNCCCEIERGQDQTNYNIAMNSNAIQNALCNSTRDIVDAQNSGTRAILDAITANRIEDKNAQITAQQNQITALQLAASQAQQNQYLLNELKPCPIPAYITCNPYQSYSLSALYGNNGCGCGCGNY